MYEIKRAILARLLMACIAPLITQIDSLFRFKIGSSCSRLVDVRENKVAVRDDEPGVKVSFLLSFISWELFVVNMGEGSDVEP